MPEGYLSDEDFFDKKLMPLFKARQREYKGMQLKLHKFQTARLDVPPFVEYFVKGPKLDWLGFEPADTRAADEDDPKRILKFLYDAATGRLHPSCFQYLIGQVTQAAIKGGIRKGFPALFRKQKWDADEALGAMRLLSAGVGQNLKERADDKAAKKRIISIPTIILPGGDHGNRN